VKVERVAASRVSEKIVLAEQPRGATCGGGRRIAVARRIGAVLG